MTMSSYKRKKKDEVDKEVVEEKEEVVEEKEEVVEEKEEVVEEKEEVVEEEEKKGEEEVVVKSAPKAVAVEPTKMSVQAYLVSKGVKDRHRAGMRAFAKTHKMSRATHIEWAQLFSKY